MLMGLMPENSKMSSFFNLKSASPEKATEIIYCQYLIAYSSVTLSNGKSLRHKPEVELTGLSGEVSGKKTITTEYLLLWVQLARNLCPKAGCSM